MAGMDRGSAGQDSAQLKFGIEAVTLCPGSCSGCLLDAADRHTPTQLGDRFFSDLRHFVMRLREIERLANPNAMIETIINFGQGDHLMLPHEELLRRLDWVASLREGDTPATCFMTLSGIGKPAIFAERIEALHAASVARGQLLNFDVVLDPVLVAKTEGAEAMLAANIATVLRVFGGCDLHVNLGPDTVGAVTPRKLLDFLSANRIGSLTVNVVPTSVSAFRFAEGWGGMVAWLTELYRLWIADPRDLSFNGPAHLFRALQALDVTAHGEDQVDAFIRRQPLRDFYITPEGRVYLAQTGLGDIALTHRSGFSPIGSLSEPERLLLLAKSGHAVAAQRCGLAAASWPACGDCRHRDLCQLSGLWNALRVFRAAGVGDASAPCPLGVLPLFDELRSDHAAQRHMHLGEVDCINTVLPHAQADIVVAGTYARERRDELGRVSFWQRKGSPKGNERA